MATINKTCKICGEYYKKLRKHIEESHNMNYIDYICTYLRDEMNGYCRLCGKPTRFSTANADFVVYCSDECKRIGIHNTQSKSQSERWKNMSKEQLDYFKLKTSIGTKKGFANMSEEQKIKYSKSRSIAATKQHQNMTEEQRENINAKISNTVRNTWKNMSKDDKYLHSQKTSIGLLSRSEEDKNLTKQKIINKYKNKSNDEKSDSMRKRHVVSTIEQYFIDRCNDLNIAFINEQMTDKYPYFCDFIIDDDLYIELNCSSFHNGHFYGEYEDDISYKTILEEKAIHSDWYNTKLIVWTKTDLEKRDCAIKNNLNHVVLWNKKQIDQFFTEYKSLSGYVDYNHKH